MASCAPIDNRRCPWLTRTGGPIANRPAACQAAPPTYGSENTYSIPPFVVYFGKSAMALTNPSAAVPSLVFNPPATTAPDQPPTPHITATYCFPSGPRYVIGCEIIPEPSLNCQSKFPLRASRAL